MTRSAGLAASLQLATTAISYGSRQLYARVLGLRGFGLYANVILWYRVRSRIGLRPSVLGF